MRKLKIFLTIFCLGIGLFIGKAVLAESNYVYDQADLLTAEEEAWLQESAEVYKNKWNMNFLVVTTDDTEGKSARAYADDFYDAYFPESSQEDGVLYLIDMDNREIYLSTCGEAIRYLTDSRIDSIVDEAFEWVVVGEYYGTFAAFFEKKQGIIWNREYHLINIIMI